MQALVRFGHIGGFRAVVHRDVDRLPALGEDDRFAFWRQRGREPVKHFITVKSELLLT